VTRPKRAGRPRHSILAAVTAVAALLVVGGVVASAVSMAYWNREESLTGLQIQTGTAGLQVTVHRSDDPALLPGTTAPLGVLAVENTGDAALALSAVFDATSSSSLDPWVGLALWPAGTPDASCDAQPDGVDAIFVGNSWHLATTLDRGETLYLCASATLYFGAGQSLQDMPSWSFDVTVKGIQ
jgi:hypothetical protein